MVHRDTKPAATWQHIDSAPRDRPVRLNQTPPFNGSECIAYCAGTKDEPDLWLRVGNGGPYLNVSEPFNGRPVLWREATSHEWTALIDAVMESRK
jgi:hypothetical protein